MTPSRVRTLALALVMVLTSVAIPARSWAVPGAEPPLTLAVLYFDYGGKDAGLEPLRQGLAQMLISDLTSLEGVKVVERERLQEVLKEQQLGTSGKLDPRTAARIGKLLGARYLVLGSYFDALGTFRADARLVNVETGEIVKSIGAGGKADEFLALEQSLARGLRDAMATVNQPPVGAPPAGVRRAAPAKPPKPPKKLAARTAVTYGRALVAMDSGDRKGARALLQDVLKEQPDFALANRDLDRLIR